MKNKKIFILLFLFMLLTLFSTACTGKANSYDYSGMRIDKALYQTLQNEDWDSMMQFSQDVINKQPDNPMGYFYKGIALYENKKYTESIENYTKAIELAPDIADNYQNRGLTYFALGEKEKARADYKKALELNPNDQIAKKQLAELENNNATWRLATDDEVMGKGENKNTKKEMIMDTSEVTSKYIPGNSMASKAVVDGNTKAIIGMLKSDKCKDVKVINSVITEQPHFVGTSLKDATGGWVEVWTFDACGEPVEVPMHFDSVNGMVQAHFSPGEFKGENLYWKKK